MWYVAFGQKKHVTYGVSCAVIREEFLALLLELRESRKSILPRRNPDRVHRISVLKISHGEIRQGSIGIFVDRVIVPDLANGVRQNTRKECF